VQTTPIAFVDTETTGLDPRRHDVWEIAVIRRENAHDTEHLWQIRPTDGQLQFVADPEALKIGRYHERMAVPAGTIAQALPTDTSGETYSLGFLGVCTEIAAALADTVMVGSNPAFDAAFLGRLLGVWPLPWHYRPVDIATLAAGYVWGCPAVDLAAKTELPPRFPYSSRDLSRAVGVEPPGPDEAHTALADARWARDMYDAVTGGPR
jgi:DNA polymerase III epsilon subunit-like protein